MQKVTAPKILVVDDSEEIHMAIKEFIADEFELDFADSIKNGLECANSKRYDMLILDVVLGDGVGIDLCKKLRGNVLYQHVPILFLTGIGNMETKLSGFSSGGDDYLLKPFDGAELLARTRALLRRSAVKQDVVLCGPLKFDLSLQRAFVQKDGSETALDLTPVEFRILLLLAQRRPVPISRNELLQTIWPKNIRVIPENIYTHVHAIRKKLESHFIELESGRGKGYVLRFTE